MFGVNGAADSRHQQSGIRDLLFVQQPQEAAGGHVQIPDAHGMPRPQVDETAAVLQPRRLGPFGEVEQGQQPFAAAALDAQQGIVAGRQQAHLRVGAEGGVLRPQRFQALDRLEHPALGGRLVAPPGGGTVPLQVLDFIALAISAILYLIYLVSIFKDAKYYAEIDPPRDFKG